MSYRIEYQYHVFRVPSAETGLPQDRFVIAVEGGDNNLYETAARNSRRVRSWGATMIGTADQVLKQAVYFAGACAGGSLKPLGRDSTAEAYITRIRRLIERDQPDGNSSAHWWPDINVEPDHPLVATAQERGLIVTLDKRYGLPNAHIVAPAGIELRAGRGDQSSTMHPKHPADFFDLINPFIGDVPAWSLAAVGGLRSS